MPSSLPTESALEKSVQTFGLGAYDFPQAGLEHGEDSNKKKSERALPDAGGPQDPFGPDRLLSYPDTVLATTMRFNDDDGDSGAIDITGTSELPGDYDVPPTSRRYPETFKDPVMSTAESALPDGGTVPRTGYYDRKYIEAFSVDNYWPAEDTTVYASTEGESSGESESLPGGATNETKLSNGLNGIGNSWSNYIVEDQNVPYGHPSDTFYDGRNYQKTNASEKSMNRVAVNVPVVRELSDQIVKSYGKKGLSRRHVMAHLKKHGMPQFIASDVIRCLHADHDIVVRDALDEFPSKTKTASSRVSSLSTVRNTLIDLELKHLHNIETSDQLRFAASDIARALAVLDRLGFKNG